MTIEVGKPVHLNQASRAMKALSRTHLDPTRTETKEYYFGCQVPCICRPADRGKPSMRGRGRGLNVER